MAFILFILCIDVKNLFHHCMRKILPLLFLLARRLLVTSMAC